MSILEVLMFLFLIFLIMTVSVVLILYILGKCKTAVGTDKCTQGPSYWCASQDQWDECVKDKDHKFSDYCKDGKYTPPQ